MTKPTDSLDALQTTLGYSFTRLSLLQEALTHPTWVNECRNRDAPVMSRDYERLEFLGDAVLALVVSQHLLQAFVDEREGQLSRRRAQLVRKEALARLGKEFNLSPFVRVGQGQKESGVADSILADVVEAILGAAFLDGGLNAVEQILGPHVLREMAEGALDGALGDDKTQLQELCHKQKRGAPRYQVVRQSGPSHARIFRVRLDFPDSADVLPIEQSGNSKKRAEQRCAKEALDRFRTQATGR